MLSLPLRTGFLAVFLAGFMAALLALPFPALADDAPAPLLMVLDAKTTAPLKAGQPAAVDVALRDEKGRPIPIENLKIVHTQKFHLFLLDPTFKDFHHVHPEPTATPGVYKFSFTPAYAGVYRLWADITDDSGQHYVSGFLNDVHAKFVGVSAPLSKSVLGYGLRIDLRFPKGLWENEAGEMRVTVTDAKTKKPFKELQPYLGAFAHAVGIMGDYETIVHSHPMGDEPGEKDLGGPTLNFHLQPQRPGILHLFIQFRVKDKIITAPFIVRVGRHKPA